VLSGKIDSALIFVKVVKVRNTIRLPPPQFLLLRRAALSTFLKELSLYIAERSRKEV
jgi:hypothetical protein